MSSLVWWGAQQIVRETFSFAAKNPAETSLAFVLIANPATRGWALDVMRAMTWRTMQMTGRLTLDIGRATVARSTTARAVWNILRGGGRVVTRHPILASAAAYSALAATAVALAQDEDPLTEQLQVKGTSTGIGGTGQPSLGSYSFGF